MYHYTLFELQIFLSSLILQNKFFVDKEGFSPVVLSLFNNCKNAFYLSFYIKNKIFILEI